MRDDCKEKAEETVLCCRAREGESTNNLLILVLYPTRSGLEHTFTDFNRGDVHPRVTWYPDNVFKGFPTLDKACEYLKAKGIYQYATDIKPISLDIVPENGSQCYYAVANGVHPGIYKRW